MSAINAQQFAQSQPNLMNNAQHAQHFEDNQSVASGYSHHSQDAYSPTSQSPPRYMQNMPPHQAYQPPPQQGAMHVVDAPAAAAAVLQQQQQQAWAQQSEGYIEQTQP